MQNPEGSSPSPGDIGLTEKQIMENLKQHLSNRGAAETTSPVGEPDYSSLTSGVENPGLITEVPGVPHVASEKPEIHAGDVVPHVTGRERVPVANPGASAIARANRRLPEGYELGVGEDGKFVPVQIDRHEK